MRVLCLICLAAWGILLARVERLPVLFQSALPGQVSLEWPQTIRQKDSSEIVLAIQLDEAEGSAAQALPDLYQTHNVVAAARLELPGLEAGRGSVREALQPGHTVTFRWQIRAMQPGTYPGTAWLHLELVPKDGGPVEEVLVMARKIEIRAVTVFGLPADAARWLGLAGIAISGVLAHSLLIGRVRRFKDRHG